jgi:hypothetical protein
MAQAITILANPILHLFVLIAKIIKARVRGMLRSLHLGGQQPRSSDQTNLIDH